MNAASEGTPIFQIGAEGGKEVAVVELQSYWDPEDPAFLISAHFLLANGLKVMIFFFF